MSSFDFTGVAFGAPAFTPTLVYAPDTRDDDQDAPRARGRTKAGKRAPSYIPRPPNAFILFRSSFIRSQNVPGRVEGNHSTLSKIIGKYWHALPPAERARWEDKARAAQAEHRRRYPDWRFRPGNGKVCKALSSCQFNFFAFNFILGGLVFWVGACVLFLALLALVSLAGVFPFEERFMVLGFLGG
ncbi:high mobility group box domain-containing protein [Mycena epipterygia]|nr:high mobility group box domain-containing protein [Mycena epipterygia]